MNYRGGEVNKVLDLYCVGTRSSETTSIDELLGRDLIPGEAWICPRPELLFTSPSVFHVTSSEALSNLVFGERLLPSFQIGKRYIGWDNRTASSHRGPAGTLVEILAEMLGIHFSGSQLLVWAGSKVDPEQVVIERDITQNPGRPSELIRNSFFLCSERRTPLSKIAFTAYDWNPEFIELIKALVDGRTIDQVDDHLSQIVLKILTSLWYATGMREGWYEMLWKRLTGNISPSSDMVALIREPWKMVLPSDVLLDRVFSEKSSQNPAGQAVILQINPQKVFQRYNHPILVMPGRHSLTNKNQKPRNPTSIIGMPNVSLTDIECVYADDPSHLPEEVTRTLINYNVKLVHHEELSDDFWLGDPSLINRTMQELDPMNPVCMMRYMADPQPIYAEQYRNGNLIPVGNIDLSDPVQKAQLKFVLGRVPVRRRRFVEGVHFIGF